jgi:transposase-like protein
VTGTSTQADHLAVEVEEARRTLEDRLRAAHLPRQNDYTTGDVARILGCCRETVRQLVRRWEPDVVQDRDPAGLFARRLSSHHRVPYDALVDWLRRNTVYARDISTA